MDCSPNREIPGVEAEQIPAPAARRLALDTGLDR